MTRHDDALSLRQMLDYAREAVDMARGRKREDLNHDRMLELALTRLVEVIGEAATRVSAEGRAQYPTIPWEQASGMRHHLIHGYDKINLDILWDTIQDDLPPLIIQLRKALREREE